LLLYWILDVYFIEFDFSAKVVLLVLIAGVYLTARWEADVRNTAALFAAFFAVIGATSTTPPLLDPPLAPKSSPLPAAASGKPVVLHFILDEHGSKHAVSAAERARGRPERIFQSYEQRGFAVQHWVRAPSGATQRSLGRVLSNPATPRGTENARESSGDFTFSLTSNDYLQWLQQQGFAMTVIQNSFLELCVGEDLTCYTYPRASHGHSMARVRGSRWDKLALALSLMHLEQFLEGTTRQVTAYQPVGQWLIDQGVMPRGRVYLTRPASVLEILDSVRAQVPHMRAGDAYLIHLLAPHFPYVLDSDCSLRSRTTWVSPKWTNEGARRWSAEESEDAYWRQAECLHSQLTQLVDELDAQLGRDNVVIMMHGDHGARLEHKGTMPTEAQLHADEADGSLDTFFMIRGRGIPSTASDQRVGLQEALWRSIQSAPSIAQPATTATAAAN
jgi:hypothetical protein